MIMYKRIYSTTIKDISYSVDFNFTDVYAKRADIDNVRCELKIASHDGYLDIFVSPKPKTTLHLDLSPLGTSPELPLSCTITKDEWEESGIARWKNLII